MYKQIQFGTVEVSKGPQFNPEVRAALESVLNNGWELDSWQAFESSNAENQPIYSVVVCLTREIDDLPVEPEDD